MLMIWRHNKVFLAAKIAEISTHGRINSIEGPGSDLRYGTYWPPSIISEPRQVQHTQN